MSSAPEPRSSPGDILTLSAKLNRAETVEAAAAHAVELSETALEQPVVSVVSCDPQTDAATVVASSTDGPDASLDRLPESVVTRLNGGDGESPSDGTPDATVNTDPPGPGSAEVFVPVGRRHVLALVTADPNGVDDPDIAAIEGLAANLDAALSRIDAQQSAAVDRDVTRTLSVENGGDREKQQQRLESFQQAVESARDGVAVLDDEEYTYVDGSHVDMYGFDDKEQLLGNTWRELYDDEEVERLEAEAFPALESEGYWRGMVTGSRPDGSTFPAELSLTTVDDGRLVCTVRDETERVERERLARTRTEFLQSVYEVTTDPELTFDEKITELLEAGRDHLDLPYGFLTRIEKGDEDESGTQTIVEALGSHELLQPGESAPLEQSYCRKTIDQDGLVALTHAAEEGWPKDLAYETFELETYIGGEVVAGADLYGTLCFASTEPRETEFDEFERSFIRLVARWAGYEIDRRNTREELREQRDRLELTLSGTNTGLAEWDLETDTVTWDETLAGIVGRDVDTVEEFREAVHPDDRDRVQRELETMVETG
jgi:PAS domain S-box-containing protein